MATYQSNGIFQPQAYDPSLVNPLQWEQANNLASLGEYGGPQTGFNAAGAPQSGWGSPGMGQGIALGLGGIQALNGIGQTYLGMKNYGLAKQTLAQNKQQYWNNFTSQARLTNGELRDRQTMRVAQNPGTQSVESYMTQNGINEKGFN